MSSRGTITVFWAACAFVTAAGADAKCLHLAVASNFLTTMRTLVNEFERNESACVEISSGASGKLFAQIRYGAPFDIFFSADQKLPEVLERENLGVPGTRFTYAEGILVAVSRPKNSPELMLQNQSFDRLALANAKLAPYGVAAEKALANLNISNNRSKPWVVAENVAQAFHFVHSGAVDIGFISLSQAIGRKNVSTWEIPKNLYTPIRQDAVAIHHESFHEGSKHFLKYIKSEEAQALIASSGYRRGILP